MYKTPLGELPTDRMIETLEYMERRAADLLEKAEISGNKNMIATFAVELVALQQALVILKAANLPTKGVQ